MEEFANWVVNGLGSFFSWIGDVINWIFSVIAGFFTWIGDVFNAIILGVWSVFQFFVQAVETIFEFIVEAIRVVALLVDLGVQIINLVIAAIGLVFAWIGQAFAVFGQIVATITGAPVQQIPGLPRCVTAPQDSEICALWYIFDYTLLADGTPGAYIIPLIVLVIDLVIVFYIIRQVMLFVGSFETKVLDT